MRLDHRQALSRTGILAALAAFDPHVAGTPPLGIDLATSDIDILCHAPDPLHFTDVMIDAFADEEDFAVWQWISGRRPVIARFTAHGWTFGIFADAPPVREQEGWRHYLVEERLLALGGAAFRAAILDERRHGAKTEPAFARALGLEGDGYRILLDLQQQTDVTLADLLARSGYG